MDYIITNIWPIQNKEVAPYGGIGINWAVRPTKNGLFGWGELVLYWDDKGNLVADTEKMANNENKTFIKNILIELANNIKVVG